MSIIIPKFAKGELVELSHYGNHFIDWGEFNPDGRKEIVQKNIPMFGYVLHCREVITPSTHETKLLYTTTLGDSTMLAYEIELQTVKELIS